MGLLAKLNAGSGDIKTEIINLFAAKMLNFVRNPFSIVKVLNSFPGLAGYDPTDPALLADYRRVVSGRRPQQAHLCAELKSYYEGLKRDGPPFDASRSEKYRPLTGAEFRETLYELQPKMKTSPMAQFADLYLWPMCMGGYNPGCLPYKRLLEDGKLIECGMTPNDVPMLGTKYYCFDAIERKGIAAEAPAPNEKDPGD